MCLKKGAVSVENISNKQNELMNISFISLKSLWPTNNISFYIPVTLEPRNLPERYVIVSLEIQAYNVDDMAQQPQGIWSIIDQGSTYGCFSINDTVGEFHFPQVVKKPQYQYQWTPPDDTTSSVYFRYFKKCEYIFEIDDI